MGGLSYDRPGEIPEGMRRLIEEQMARERGTGRRGAAQYEGNRDADCHGPAALAMTEDGGAGRLIAAPTALDKRNGPIQDRPLRRWTRDQGETDHGRKTRKYHNMPTERLLPNGECVKFQSKKEALRYDYLRMEQEAGRIRKLRLQVQYLIQEAYTDGETGERFRGASYYADFVYERIEDGKWVRHVEDTKGGGRKGTATKTYQLKRKLVEDMGVHVEEV